MKSFRLSDSAIAHVAQLLQLALITQSDVTQHLRTMLLDGGEDGTLTVNPEYAQSFEKEIERLLAAAQETLGEPEEETPGFA